jgi:hypothetical protein
METCYFACGAKPLTSSQLESTTCFEFRKVVHFILEFTFSCLLIFFFFFTCPFTCPPISVAHYMQLHSVWQGLRGDLHMMRTELSCLLTLSSRAKPQNPTRDPPSQHAQPVAATAMSETLNASGITENCDVQLEEENAVEQRSLVGPIYTSPKVPHRFLIMPSACIDHQLLNYILKAPTPLFALSLAATVQPELKPLGQLLLLPPLFD